MANVDNKCSNLIVEDLYDESKTHLEDIYNLQKELQKSLGNDFENWTLNQIAEFWLLNSHCEVDETHEMFDALGGINDGIGNSAWKKWKVKNKESYSMTIESLSQSDLKELKMEIIDKMHFFFNYAISIGMTPREIYNMYISKNKENFDRQKRGY